MEGHMEWRWEVTGRQGRRCKQLLDDIMEKRGSWKLREEVLHIIVWRTRFERAIVRQTTKWMNEWGNEWTNELMFTRSRSCTLFQGNWLYSLFLRAVTFTTILKSLSHLYFGDLSHCSIRYSRTTYMISKWPSKLLFLDGTEGNVICY
jgi:hypothetical protein